MRLKIDWFSSGSLLVWTTSAPYTHRSSISIIISGGCCISPSIVMAQSPLQWSNPTLRAIWCPKFLDKEIYLISVCSLELLYIFSKVLSVLPSSINNISLFFNWQFYYFLNNNIYIFFFIIYRDNNTYLIFNIERLHISAPSSIFLHNCHNYKRH